MNHLEHSTEASAARKREPLQSLDNIKSQLCFCSVCGSRMKFRSFTAHPCFKEAVVRLGKWRARQVVKRLSEPPKTSEPWAPEQRVDNPPWLVESADNAMVL